MTRLEQVWAVVASVAIAVGATSAHAQWKPAAPPATANDPASGSQPWREAKAQLPPPEHPESASQERTWYGWQTLVTDALGVGLIAFGGGSVVPGILGLSLLGLGAPVVHFAHSNLEGGLYSLAIRGSSVGLFVLGGVLVVGTLFEDGEDGSQDEEVFGAVLLVAGTVGALTAVCLDAALFSYEPKTRARTYTATSVTPWFDPRRGSYGVRVGLVL